MTFDYTTYHYWELLARRLPDQPYIREMFKRQQDRRDRHAAQLLQDLRHGTTYRPQQETVMPRDTVVIDHITLTREQVERAYEELHKPPTPPKAGTNVRWREGRPSYVPNSTFVVIGGELLAVLQARYPNHVSAGAPRIWITDGSLVFTPLIEEIEVLR